MPLIPMALLLVYYQNRQQDNILETHYNLAEIVSYNIKNYTEDLGWRLAFAPRLSAAAEQGTDPAPILREALEMNPDFAFLALLGPDGKERARVAKNAELDIQKEIDLSAEPQLADIAQNRRVYLTGMDKAGAWPVVEFVYPLSDGMFLYGVLGMYDLLERIQQMRIGQTGQVFLAAPTGTLMTLPYQWQPDIRAEELQKLFAGENRFIKKLKTASETFAAETPFFFSRGNHETRGRLAYEFLNYFPTPSGRPYYTFQNGPAYFIVLDGGEDKPDNDIEYHGLGDYDRYRNEEARWLQEIVQSEAFRQAAFRIVLMHVTPVNDSWHGALETRQKFVPILNGHGIDLMLCGHTHQAYYAPAGENGCDFPLLINAPDQAVDLDISDRQLTLTVRDSQHRTIKTLNFPTKK